jgi:hypothetical protein
MMEMRACVTAACASVCLQLFVPAASFMMSRCKEIDTVCRSIREV